MHLATNSCDALQPMLQVYWLRQKYLSEHRHSLERNIIGCREPPVLMKFQSVWSSHSRQTLQSSLRWHWYCFHWNTAQVQPWSPGHLQNSCQLWQWSGCSILSSSCSGVHGVEQGWDKHKWYFPCFCYCYSLFSSNSTEITTKLIKNIVS